MDYPVIVITGAGQGIGRATASYLAAQSYRVALLERDAEAGREALAEVEARGEGLFVETDVADETSVRRAMDQVVGHWGGIDYLFNNAGFAINKPLEELSLDEWNRVIGTNLTGPFLCAKYAARYLRARRGGIVNVSSIRRTMTLPDTEAYSAAKGGVVGLTQSLAISLGPEVRVNSISPGWIDIAPWQKESNRKSGQLSEADHAQHPVGRVGVPQDIAYMVEYLCSEKSGFITGQDFLIDGGMARKMIYV